MNQNNLVKRLKKLSEDILEFDLEIDDNSRDYVTLGTDDFPDLISISKESKSLVLDFAEGLYRITLFDKYEEYYTDEFFINLIKTVVDFEQ